MLGKPQNATALHIQDLALRHHVAYVPKPSDRLAHHITRLSGDDVKLDEVEQLLIALQRAGHLTRAELIRLQASYLREAKQ
jgi:hypothetical protein